MSGSFAPPEDNTSWEVHENDLDVADEAQSGEEPGEGSEGEMDAVDPAGHLAGVYS